MPRKFFCSVNFSGGLGANQPRYVQLTGALILLAVVFRHQADVGHQLLVDERPEADLEVRRDLLDGGGQLLAEFDLKKEFPRFKTKTKNQFAYQKIFRQFEIQVS